MVAGLTMRSKPSALIDPQASSDSGSLQGPHRHFERTATLTDRGTLHNERVNSTGDGDLRFRQGRVDGG
jgi:hypothetical protein